MAINIPTEVHLPSVWPAAWPYQGLRDVLGQWLEVVLQPKRDPLPPELGRAFQVRHGYVPYANAGDVLCVLRVYFLYAARSLAVIARSCRLSMGASLGGLADEFRFVSHWLPFQLQPLYCCCGFQVDHASVSLPLPP